MEEDEETPWNIGMENTRNDRRRMDVDGREEERREGEDEQ